MIALLTPLMLTLGPLALLLAMLVVFTETGLMVGVVLPGDSLLFTVGVMAAAGVIPLPLWLVVLGLVAAATAGDQVGYLIGRRYGPGLFTRPRSRFFSPTHLERAHAFFLRHGRTAVVLARFVPVVRSFTPVVAGTARMPRRAFTAYNLAGGLAWVVGFVVVGYFLGGVPLIAAHIELFAIGLVALSLLPAAAGLLLRRPRRRAVHLPRARSGSVQVESTRIWSSRQHRPPEEHPCST